MAADQDRTERPDEQRLDDEGSEPGPRREADPQTQADAGLTGGVAEADAAERVGVDDDGNGGASAEPPDNEGLR